MKSIWTAAVTAAAITFASQSVLAVEKDDLKTLTDKTSYLFGYNIGQNLQRDELEVDVDLLVEALRDAMAGKPSLMTQQEVQQTMRTLQDKQQAKRAEAVKEMGDANLKKGQAFIAEYAKKDGVKKTESGLLYRVMTAGSGKTPAPASTVSVHYKGTLTGGQEFDSSYSRGEPAQFGVTQVIPGWTEVLQMMKEGDKWEVVIPSNLAYGPGGAGGSIGPNETLVFEIELLEVK